jgi:hypothetical protein
MIIKELQTNIIRAEIGAALEVYHKVEKTMIKWRERNPHFQMKQIE